MSERGFRPRDPRGVLEIVLVAIPGTLRLAVRFVACLVPGDGWSSKTAALPGAAHRLPNRLAFEPPAGADP